MLASSVMVASARRRTRALAALFCAFALSTSIGCLVGIDDGLLDTPPEAGPSEAAPLEDAALHDARTDDQWADPPGQFDTLKAAAPVYKLLGVDGLGVAKRPAEGVLLGSRLGYWVRPGKHSMTPADWATYLAFADKWLK